MKSYQYMHGLGDASLYAHVVRLYTERGEEVEISTEESKAVLFRAAGANLVPNAQTVHPYLHPNSVPHTLDNPQANNKVAHNLGGSWDELCKVRMSLDEFVTKERDVVASYFSSLPRPIVLFHGLGNTGPHMKNLTQEEQAGIIHGLIDRTDGTVLVLDWDNRAYWLHSFRVRNMAHSWHNLDTLELYEAIKQCDLFIGVDSGPLHFTRFTDTKALGIWTRHEAPAFALPRENTLHCVPGVHTASTRYRRLEWNLTECPGERVSPGFIVDHALALLGGASPQELVVRNLVGKLRTIHGGLDTYADRHRSFGRLFELAGKNKSLAWVETGCMRSEEDWTAGASTYIFGAWLKLHGGHLDSVDITPEHCVFARSWTRGLPVRVHQSCSLSYLEKRETPIDVLYLDSLDTYVPGHAEHALEEIRLSSTLLHNESIILIDDCAWDGGSFCGKGRLAIPFLLEHGWRIKYSGWQTLLGKDT